MLRIKRPSREAGFTLLELLISVLTTSILCGAVVLCISTTQKSYHRSEIANALDQQMRSALELMSQDISQAGLTGTDSSTATQVNSLTGNDNPTALATLNSPVTSASTNATVSPNAGGMFPGQTLFIGTGADQESIIVGNGTSGTTMVSAFLNSHAVGEPIMPHGVFRDGVVPTSAMNTSVTVSGPSTATSLHLYGDLRGNGTISVVDYVCPTSTSPPPTYTDTSGTVWAPLVRYEYDNALNSSTVTSHVNLLDMVAVTSTGCFNYSYVQQSTGGMTNQVFVNSVQVTIRAMAGGVNSSGGLSPQLDPNTQAPITVSRSFLTIQPRNIIAAYYYAKYCAGTGSVLPDRELMSMPAAIQSMIVNIP
jgi:type II secretory pathway pseudopilin PulG